MADRRNSRGCRLHRKPMTKPDILYCQCAHTELVPGSEQEKIRAILGQVAERVIPISDLCGWVARKAPELKEWANTPGLNIIACYPRSVIELFRAAGVTLDTEQVTLINQRASTPEEIAEQLGLDPDPVNVEPIEPAPVIDDASPWFPVIDRSRCVDCKQCLNFCLFDTYQEAEDGSVEVANPLNCKLNCPACARICPEAAIIFPKYADAPINGDNISDEAAVKEQIQVNVEEILGNDIYAALARRKARAKRRLLRPHIDPLLADAEREKFLKETSTPISFAPPSKPTPPDQED
jgi:NAD-dependent dihydropyrimidine dehydrogenase PreA subunit